MRHSTRRAVLSTVALTATAGCLTGRGTDAPASATERTPPDSLEQWLGDANGYDGERRRYPSGAQPTVAVGEPTDDGIAFDPVVAVVTPLSAVTWEWTGHGGQHNVVALDGTFDSGRTNSQAGTAYNYIFEETGTYPYVSEPHGGMRGAVVVREPPSTGYQRVDEWLAGASNFDGTVVDRTGADTATVTVGADSPDGAFAFDPLALEVSPGTTVVWEWSGEGGPHNVAFEDAAIDSGPVTASAGTTFSHTFESTGQYRYHCAPHRALGMRGAVIVE